jgi:hypothetical protein
VDGNKVVSNTWFKASSWVLDTRCRLKMQRRDLRVCGGVGVGVGGGTCLGGSGGCEHLSGWKGSLMYSMSVALVGEDDRVVCDGGVMVTCVVGVLIVDSLAVNGDAKDEDDADDEAANEPPEE